MDSLSPMEGLQKMPEGSAVNYAFANETGKFTNRAAEWGLGKKGFSNGALVLDLDNDGDLDIVTNNLNERATVYENNTSKKDSARYLLVQLNGNPKNKWGIGTRIAVFVNGKRQMQENKPTSGWLSSKHSNTVHFGLGTAQNLDSLKVLWPDGRQQTLANIETNDKLQLSWKDASPVTSRPEREKTTILTDIGKSSGIDFVHQEDVFTNFHIEKLIPRTLSTEGPKMAVGDVNNDGLDDFYIGGAKGQAGALYIQNSGGSTVFSKKKIPIFDKHWVHEDTAATFFDADADGDLDLYVVSGGGQVFKGEVLKDRLYTNNGNGHFSYVENYQIPNTEFNGSCAVPFDMNEDGLMDLFVGNRAYPTKYGLPAASKFFLNRGNGKFVDASISLLEHRGSIGMVTDAVWNEDQKELLIVGEWMPITIYGFYGGTIERKQLENTAGWWNTVDLADLNGDGQEEVLLGNLGLNSNLQASIEQPIDIYIHDFDGNLSTDPIISYYKNEKRWPYAGLDLLADQIVNVKRSYRTYEKFANSSFSEIFPEEQLKKGHHAQVQTLASSYLIKEEGRYKLHSLPEVVQFSAINGFVSDDFNDDGQIDVLVVGNFFGNHPAMGRSDAAYGTYLSPDQDGNFRELSHAVSGFVVDGESRDIKVLRGPNGTKFVIVSRNNEGVKVFAYRAW